MLGICLGHQVIYEALGGLVVRAVKPMHGRTTPMQLADTPLFEGIPDQTPFARYHSLIGQTASLPKCLQVIAWSPEQEIMAVGHRDFPVFGVQFHPESVLSTAGFQLLANFLRLAGLTTPTSLPTNDYLVSALTNSELEAESDEHPVVLPTAYSMLK
jgi:anthranilate synthase component 2